MMHILKSFLLLLALSPITTNAIGINSMVEFAKDDEGTFTITNPASYRQFIQVGISELKVTKEGGIEYIPYTRKNINDWSLTVRPSRTVIDPKLRKVFKLQYDQTKSQNTDKAFRLTFIPTPYFNEGEPTSHTVQVAVGFAPLFIVPATQDQPLNYKMSYKNDKLEIINSGKTYIRAFLDSCPKEYKGKDREKCSKVIYVLSGRRLPVELSNEMRKAPYIKVELSTHNSTYKRSFVITKGQVAKD